jgi:Cft2 family RNA processing exonuclease
MLIQGDRDRCEFFSQVLQATRPARSTCTPATHDLCSVMLGGAVHMQQADADFMNQKHRDLPEEPVVPLCDEADVLKAMRRFRSLADHQPAPVLGEFARI